MKVILRENLENLGKRGDIVDVAPGYGRNYLLPRKLAVQVTASNMKMVEMEQRIQKKKLEKEIVASRRVVDRLNEAHLTFERKAGDKDVIFGSVSAGDIKEALEKLGIEVEKKKILLDEPIKRLGNYTVPVKVFHDERAAVKVEVKREGEPEAAAEESVAAEQPGEKATGPESETAAQEGREGEPPAEADAQEERPEAEEGKPEK